MIQKLLFLALVIAHTLVCNAQSTNYRCNRKVVMFIQQNGLANQTRLTLADIRDEAGVKKELLPVVVIPWDGYSSRLSSLGIKAADSQCGWVVQCDSQGLPSSVLSKVFSEESREGARRLFQAWVNQSPLDLSDNEASSDTVKSQVEGWRSAWADRSASRFLSFYSPIYWHAEKDLSYAGWEKDRAANFASKKEITVDISGVSVNFPHPYEARATFHQVYSSIPRYSDRGTKTLIFFRHKDGTWKIVKESWKAD